MPAPPRSRSFPFGRALAWFGLPAVVAAIGRIAGRECGTTAAITAGLLYMWAHGRPRFASTIADTWTIRLGFLLGACGALAAAAPPTGIDVVCCKTAKNQAPGC